MVINYALVPRLPLCPNVFHFPPSAHHLQLHNENLWNKHVAFQRQKHLSLLLRRSGCCKQALCKGFTSCGALGFLYCPVFARQVTNRKLLKPEVMGTCPSPARQTRSGGGQAGIFFCPDDYRGRQRHGCVPVLP